MSFRPIARSQFQPVTRYSPSDCVPSVTGRLIARATVDAKNPDHDAVRTASGVTTNRGLSYLEGENAAAKYGVKLSARFGLSRNQVQALAVAGYGFGLSIDCSVTAKTTRRTNSFTGNHTVYVQSYNLWPGGERCACELTTTTRHGEFSIDDPGTTSVGYLQWSADLAYRAAESRTAGHGINVLASPDTEGVSRKCVRARGIRTKASYASPGIGVTVKGHVYACGSTANGDSYTLPDGRTANGWVQVTLPNGKHGWVIGESFV